MPLPISSIDTAPFGPGLAPDSSEEGRTRNAAMYEANHWFEDDLSEYCDAVYQSLGAKTRVTKPVMDFWITGADVTAQPCSSSLEYPRSDISPKIHFIGGLKRPKLDQSLKFPDWWEDVLAAKREEKKVVFVTQGTVILDYRMLLIPTIEALASEGRYLVLGLLGKRGAELDGTSLPANARIVDYLPYDAVLPYADVVVSNGGYGGFMQSVMHGFPMLLAGIGRKSLPFVLESAPDQRLQRTKLKYPCVASGLELPSICARVHPVPRLSVLQSTEP